MCAAYYQQQNLIPPFFACAVPLVANATLTVEDNIATLNLTRPITSINEHFDYHIEVFNSSSDLVYSVTTNHSDTIAIFTDANLVQCLTCACHINVTVRSQSYNGPPHTVWQSDRSAQPNGGCGY